MLSDKYKPFRVDDVLLEDNVKIKIKNFVKNRNLPNMIVTGPSGCGKSCLSYAIACDTYGKNVYHYVNRLNSSLERNVKLLQESLEQFCRKVIVDPKSDTEHVLHDGISSDNKRMFIIDDIDNMPKKIQIVIASFMEKYQNITFIFTCTEVTDIIEVIQSCCIILHIKKPRIPVLFKYLSEICKKEHCPYNDDALERICFLSQCDIRLAINNVQTLAMSFGKITMNNISKICDVPNVETITKILINCINNNVVDALCDATKLSNDGYYCIDILACLYDVISSQGIGENESLTLTKIPASEKRSSTTYQLDENLKLVILPIVGKSMYYVNKRIDSIIQLERCIIKICKKINVYHQCLTR